jgi:hypothetical protein
MPMTIGARAVARIECLYVPQIEAVRATSRMQPLSASRVPGLHLNNGQAAMFGYGSLILLESMERTLGRQYSSTRYECGLRGWKRVWTSLYPNTTFYSTGPDGEKTYPKNILYLNIARAEGSSCINGIIYVVDGADLAAFDRRENIYDRVDVTAEVTGPEVIGGPVWAYVGKAPFVMNERLPVGEAAIRSSYLEIIEKGLSELGPQFRRQYESSSEAPPPSNIINDLN